MTVFKQILAALNAILQELRHGSDFPIETLKRLLDQEEQNGLTLLENGLVLQQILVALQGILVALQDIDAQLILLNKPVVINVDRLDVTVDAPISQ